MSRHPNYRVTVTRDDGLWAAVADGLPPGVIGATDVERFGEVEPAVRDLIAGLTGLPESGFTIEIHYVQGDVEYTSAIHALRAGETQLAEAAAARDAARRAAVDAMRRSGLSLRDIADVMGVSHQRVHQILHERSTAAG